MPKALLAAVLATALASASASYAYAHVYNQYPAQTPATPVAKAATADNPAPTRVKLQSGAETVKVRAVYSPDVRPNPSADEPEPGESGWRSYGMLLATLVLMGVIAVRRYKAGRP